MVEPTPADDPILARTPAGGNALRRLGGVAVVFGLGVLAGWGVELRPLVVKMGGWPAWAVAGAWERARATEARPEEVLDGRLRFYHRPLPPNVTLRTPVRAPRGPLVVTVWASTNVRGRLEAFAGGERKAVAPLQPGGRWVPHRLDVPSSSSGAVAGLQLAVRYEPLTRGEHVTRPRFLVERIEVSAPDGLRLAWPAVLTLALVPPLVALFGWGIGSPRGGALAGAVLVPVLALALHLDPATTLPAAPRLAVAAVLAGVLAAVALRGAGIQARDVTMLAAVVAAGVAWHGSIVFFPEHAPPDRDTHVGRALDLARVPATYAGWLRYGSHLPTASQTDAPATDLFGDAALIPYSPVPYLAYYGLHVLGLDLAWSLGLLTVVLAMAVVPAMFVSVSEVFDRRAAWLSVVLHALDLPVWHHAGRAHAPAVFGAALATIALLHLARRSGALAGRRWVAAGLLLGLAMLGYTSMAVLLGLFGVVLLTLLVLDAAAIAASERWRLALAVLAGGLFAGVVFYFHYVPGLLSGAGAVAQVPDLFPGRGYLFFRNESRHSLRVWEQGYALWLAAGLACAPLALRRAAAAARPVLWSWLGAWVLVVILKDPLFFPRMLRWAKEDLFVSPLVCLFVAAAVAAVPRPSWRRLAVLAAVGAALTLQVRDFARHLVTLRFLVD